MIANPLRLNISVYVVRDCFPRRQRQQQQADEYKPLDRRLAQKLVIPRFINYIAKHCPPPMQNPRQR